jgi:hypothetical protein
MMKWREQLNGYCPKRDADALHGRCDLICPEFPEDETFDIGQDTRTGVAMVEYRYDSPFKFTGKINKLTFKLDH